MKQTFTFLFLIAFTIMGLNLSAQNAWINEFHYDNAGGDVGEFVEIVIENAGSYNLNDFTLTLYNGNNGGQYNSKTGDEFTVGATVNGFTFYYYNFPVNGIQNGAPDGMALDFQGTVITDMFISYEGSFAATDGPANGITSIDIGVSESSSTPIGHSLQLSGVGSAYADFTWQQPDVETKGNLNNGQTIGAAPDPEPSNYPTNFTADVIGLRAELEWTDATGAQLPYAYLILVKDGNSITPPVDGTPVADDLDLSDGNGAINVLFGEEAAIFYNLSELTTYYFEIYPYTNGGNNIDYKTDGTVPADNGTTLNAVSLLDFDDDTFGTWDTISVASDKDWAIEDWGGATATTYFGRMNGYNENVPSNDWLISPSIDLLQYIDENITFWTYWKYGNADDELKFKYSTDYTSGDDPTTATWTELSFTKAGSDDTWEFSGDIDVSGIVSDNVHFAFHYLSNGSPRRWDVDQIEITGDAIVPLITVTSPELGEIWEAGSSEDIEWTVSNTQSNVMIELTTNASSGTPTWETLAASVPASQGSWTWNIPSDQTPSYDCQIRITDFTADAAGFSGIFWIIEEQVIPDLVITEIMYNPPESGTDSLEFIEIYNNDVDTIDMDGYYFSDGVDFTFDDVVLNPGEYVLVAVNAEAFENTYGFMAYEYSGALDNGGELVQLVNSFGYMVDSVNYGTGGDWPTEPDGNGPSLVFCNPDLDNSEGINWDFATNFIAINADGDTIWATPNNGCGSQPMTNFEADYTIILEGETVTFTDMSSNDPDSWAWTFEGGDPATSTDQNPIVKYDVAGTYDVTLVATNMFGSHEITKTDYIEVRDGVGIIESNSGNVSIYPNPNNGSFILTNSTGSDIEVQVYSLLGEAVYSSRITDMKASVNLKNVENGIYFARIIASDNSVKTIKLIIE